MDEKMTTQVMPDESRPQIQPRRGLQTIDITKQADPLRAYIAQGVAERPEALGEEYSRLSGLLGRGGFGAPQGGGAAASPLMARLQQVRDQDYNLGLESQQRQIPLEYAQRQQGYQRLANAKLATEQQRELGEAEARAAAQAKKDAFKAGVFGLGGAVVGGALGGPAGAQIGAGAGTLAAGR